MENYRDRHRHLNLMKYLQQRGGTWMEMQATVVGLIAFHSWAKQETSLTFNTVVKNLSCCSSEKRATLEDGNRLSQAKFHRN